MKKRALLLILLCFTLAGCTKSRQDYNNVETTPDGLVDATDEYDDPEEEDEWISWDQVEEDSFYLGEPGEEYDEAIAFTMTVDEDSQQLTLFALVTDEAEPEEVLEYAGLLLRKFNDIVREQDYSIKRSSDSYYGGIYDTFSVHLGVASESSQDDPSGWFVNTEIPAGSDFAPLELQQS